jgi:signal peptidase I
MTKERGGKALEKFWHLLWKDESIWGWIFSIIVLFVFIKFIFFPILAIVTGSSLPLAIVESCSMYHGEIPEFENWYMGHEDKYKQLGINQQEFSDFPLKNGFNKGDVLLIIKAKPEKLKVGDIIIFNAQQANPIIHRIIKVTEQDEQKVFSTIGDNNDQQHSFEKEITENELVGKNIVKIIPYVGWLKLVFFENKKPSNERGFCKVR